MGNKQLIFFPHNALLCGQKGDVSERIGIGKLKNNKGINSPSFDLKKQFCNKIKNIYFTNATHVSTNKSDVQGAGLQGWLMHFEALKI